MTDDWFREKAAATVAEWLRPTVDALMREADARGFARGYLEAEEIIRLTDWFREKSADLLADTNILSAGDVRHLAQERIEAALRKAYQLKADDEYARGHDGMLEAAEVASNQYVANANHIAGGRVTVNYDDRRDGDE